MNILIVDDDIGVRESLSLFFSSYDHHVCEAANGEDALNILDIEQIDLVLSDIYMPKMNGHDLLKRIKQSPQLKNIVVILITGYGEIKSAIDAMKQGAYDYLLKPLNLNELSIQAERVSEYISLKRENEQLTERFDEAVVDATKEVKKELKDLRKAYAEAVGTSECGIFSDKLKSVFKTARKFHANRNFPVLIEGETGTGKELVARYIHYGNGVETSPFVAINCSALSQNLFESELFGYEKGAFTGGDPKGKKGKIELAEGGSILLDEISELTPEYQSKLLRIIQEKEYYRVGGLKKYTCNVRFICTINQDIKNLVSDGSFREDLYFRLNVGHIIVPPLRERKEEILPLANRFLERLSKQKASSFKFIDKDARALLKSYSWPGNVRELKSTIERIALLYDEETIRPSHLVNILNNVYKKKQNIDEIHRNNFDNIALPMENIDLNTWIADIVAQAMTMQQNNISATARYLHISRNRVYKYLKESSN